MIMRSVIAALVALSLGCAEFAKRPDSPAAKITVEELEQTPAPPNERYYLLVYGSQSVPVLPRRCHTFATAVRVVDQGAGVPPCMEAHTISWFPASLDVRPWHFRVEPGVNLELHKTIEFTQGQNQRVSLWGPFEIRPGLYRKFVMQHEWIDSGSIGYQCIDTVGESARCGNGSDCIHAIADADAKIDRRGYALTRFGDRASENIVHQIAARGGFIDYCQTHDWLIPALKLDQYCIVRRPYDGPSWWVKHRAKRLAGE
jgi:hypothetical protein